MTEPRIPEPRDDDPEDVSDKLSIAVAMWARGDRADALSWLRRAAESASDSDADMRALELAKAASELAPHTQPAAPAPAAPPPPPPAAAAAVAPAAPRPAAPARASVSPQAAAAKVPMPTAKPKPGASRPPGGKLAPLPPLRPLGSAPAPARPMPSAPPRATPSVVTSVTGATSTSGSIPREEAVRQQASAPMPWDEAVEDEPTRQIALEPAEDAAFEAEATGTLELDPEETSTSAPALEPPLPLDLPLAVGVRVRLVVEGNRVVAEPDRGQLGVLAIVTPVHPEDDLRTVFQR